MLEEDAVEREAQLARRSQAGAADAFLADAVRTAAFPYLRGRYILGMSAATVDACVPACVGERPTLAHAWGARLSLIPGVCVLQMWPFAMRCRPSTWSCTARRWTPCHCWIPFRWCVFGRCTIAPGRGRCLSAKRTPPVLGLRHTVPLLWWQALPRAVSSCGICGKMFRCTNIRWPVRRSQEPGATLVCWADRTVWVCVVGMSLLTWDARRCVCLRALVDITVPAELAGADGVVRKPTYCTDALSRETHLAPVVRPLVAATGESPFQGNAHTT